MSRLMSTLLSCCCCAVAPLATAANADGARHYCGEAHAQVYVSRWFESVCSPPKPDFLRSSQAK